jgi:c-di-GMP-binding flagellar brake protein YcgR
MSVRADESPTQGAGTSAVSGNGRRQSDEERRRAGRVSATFAVSEVDGSHVHLCQAEDIAVGGITIKHARGLAHQPRTEVALRFALPGSREEIQARGEIVSDSRAGRFRRTGVRFLAVRPDHQQLIAAYCRR